MSAKRYAMASAAVAALAEMDLRGLSAKWWRRYGAAPRHRSADLPRRAMAWPVQGDLLGWFDAVPLRLLVSDKGKLTLGAKPSMRLARE